MINFNKANNKKKFKNLEFYFFLTLVLCVFSFSACKSDFKDNSDRFKVGVFEIPAGKDFVKETIIRKDTIQISKYGDNIKICSKK